MYEHVRAELTAAARQAADALAAAEQDLPRLRAEVAQRDAARAGAEQAVAVALPVTQAAAADLEAAEATAGGRRAARDAAAAVADQARRDLSALLDDEPDRILPSGKPNPAWPAWNNRRKQAEQRVATASAALASATADLTAAQQVRDTAATAAAQAADRLAAAQAGLARAQIALDAARAALDAATQGLPECRRAVDRAQAALTALEARIARLVAVPLDRADLAVLAGDEYAELALLRRRRAEHLVRRAAHVTGARSRLSVLPPFAAGVASLRDALAAWPEAGRYPSLGAAGAGLTALLNEVAQHPGDLGALLARLGEVEAALRTAVALAGKEQTDATGDLAGAAQALAEHQKEQP